MATLTLSMAMTDFTASTTRKYTTAETSTLTLSRVMMPWDCMGMVTIRNDTRRRVSMKGTMTRKPGSRVPMTRPKRNHTPFSYCLTIRSARANPIKARTKTMAKTAIMTFTPGRPSGHLAAQCRRSQEVEDVLGFDHPRHLTIRFHWNMADLTRGHEFDGLGEGRFRVDRGQIA